MNQPNMQPLEQMAEEIEALQQKVEEARAKIAQNKVALERNRKQREVLAEKVAAEGADEFPKEMRNLQRAARDVEDENESHEMLIAALSRRIAEAEEQAVSLEEDTQVELNQHRAALAESLVAEIRAALGPALANLMALDPYLRYPLKALEWEVFSGWALPQPSIEIPPKRAECRALSRERREEIETRRRDAEGAIAQEQEEREREEKARKIQERQQKELEEAKLRSRVPQITTQSPGSPVHRRIR